MNFNNLIKPLNDMEEYKLLLSAAHAEKGIVEAHGITETQKALISVALCKNLNKKCLVITHNEIAAKKLYEDMNFFEEGIAQLLPSEETVFHKLIAKSGEIRQERLKVLNNSNSAATNYYLYFH